ncbi:beta strand repeat-containing protein [Butyrivibrio fibrisolvens]|uniref:beta strand repeat-containing protein n=1 Tax=Butyrivibrio fibrisolvens TaxID=831 RepID=UPI0003B59749|nr:hypothetical protein [Butyrivibrio fibrisolvens]
MINKKILVTLSATTAIFFMLLSPSITSYAAEDQDSTVTTTNENKEVGNVTTDGGTSAVGADNSTVNVQGDITTSGTNGSYAADDQNSTVTATNTTVEVGNVTIDGGTSAVVADNSTVNVQGDITTSGDTGSYHDNDGDEHFTASPAVVATNGSTVNVDGDIKAGTAGAEQTAITATNGSTVTVEDGNVSGTYDGINSTSSTVTVDGNVSGSNFGVSASNGSTITVNGNVISNGIQTDIPDSETGEVFTSYTGTGVYSYGENTIIITGDVSSVGNGVCINLGDTPSDNDNNGEIIIGGTVVGGIHINDNSDASTFSTPEQILNSTPEITVYAIDDSNYVPIGLSFKAYDWSTEADREVLNGIKDEIGTAINYIIKVNETSAKAYGITVSGDHITQKGGYQTVNINESFTVAATLSEGYTINGGKNVIVTDNHDGTFTLTLTNPYYGNTISGGIYVDVIEVKVIPVTNTDGSTTIVVEPEPVTETYTEPYNDPTQAPAGSIVVTTNTGNDTATSEFTTAISGDKPAQTISFTMSSVTPQQYKNAIISSVASVPSNGAFNIVTDTIGCLDAGMIEAFSSRPDIDVNIVFYYGGKQMKVTIPAGYDLNLLLDEHGYCGFLRLMSILGGTEI